MQITIRSSKILKQGKKKDGTPYTWVAVTAEDTGIEYTTFDKKANAGTGAVLDIGESVIKEGKHSFKECKIISEGQVPTEVKSNSMTSEDWANKQRLERESIESQVAYKGIIELMVAKIAPEDAVSKALCWAMSKLGNVPSRVKTAPVSSQKSDDISPQVNINPSDAPAQVETVSPAEDLFTWIATNMNWKSSKSARLWIINVCKIPEDKIDSDPEGCKQEIALLQDWTL